MMKVKVDTHMKGINVLLYGLKQGIKNIRQNGLFTLASVGTISACLFLFGIFYFMVCNFQYMVKNAETSVGVTVFFDEGISEDTIQSIGNSIRQREEVLEVKYVSAEEAWENFKKDVFADSEAELSETFGTDNPLKDSASYEVYLNDVSRQNGLIKYIKKLDGVREVKGSAETAKGLGNINRLVGYVSAAIIIILLAVSIFLINTTVSMGIAVRKEEIGIMKLVGATDSFIRLPFIIEGVVIGLIGAIIPLIILHFMYSGIISFIADKFSALSDILVFLDVKDIFNVLIPVSIAVGVGIGFAGSVWTMRKHLRV